MYCKFTVLYTTHGSYVYFIVLCAVDTGRESVCGVEPVCAVVREVELAVCSIGGD